jgi:hypothetical protein
MKKQEINKITISHGEPGHKTTMIELSGDPLAGKLDLTFSRVPSGKTMTDLEYRLEIAGDHMDYLLAMLEEKEILDQKDKVRWSDGEVHIFKRPGSQLQDFGRSTCDLTVKWEDAARAIFCLPGKQNPYDDQAVIIFRLSPLEKIRVIKLIQRIINQTSILTVLKPLLVQILRDTGDRYASR